MTDYTYQTTKALCSSAETRPRERVQGDRFMCSSLFSAAIRTEREGARIRPETCGKFSSGRSTLAGVVHFPGKEGKKILDIKSPHPRSLSAPLEPPPRGNHDFKCLAFGSLFLFAGLYNNNKVDLGHSFFCFSFSLL